MPISITAINSISPLGFSLEEAWKQYQSSNHFIKVTNFVGKEALVAPLSTKAKMEIKVLKKL